MRRLAFVAALFCVLATASSVEAQESASFRLERSAVVAGADGAVSASFSTLVSVAQAEPAAISGACGGTSSSAFGFWSVLGTSTVPIELDVARNPSVAGEVDLFWSGSADLFQVYRGFVASSLITAGNLYLEQPTCAAADTLSTSSPIVFYTVVEKP